MAQIQLHKTSREIPGKLIFMRPYLTFQPVEALSFGLIACYNSDIETRRRTFRRAWMYDALAAFARVMTFIAVLALGLSGGVYSHAEELVHDHAIDAHHSHHHSHNQEDCCDSGVSETVHCGANLLTLTELYQLHHPARIVESIPFEIQEFPGASLVIDPPPPRSLLV